jgi:predicted nuclease with TOPRIM domain
MNEELKKVKLENQKLNDEIKALKLENQKSNDEIKALKLENQKLNDDLKKVKNPNTDLNNQINSLKNKINEQMEEIKNLNNRIIALNNNKNNNMPNSMADLSVINPGEKILCVQFISNDRKIDLALLCKNVQLFDRLEEELYLHYPEYKESNNIFTANGKEILRFKTIEENNIKSSDKIIINK